MSASPVTSSIELNAELRLAMRIVLPVLYALIALCALAGNLVATQIIFANRFRHKSIHLLVASIALADTCFVLIFATVRALSYAESDSATSSSSSSSSSTSQSWWWWSSSGASARWCTAEMYLLRLFDFVLAYTVVFMCLDRAVRAGSLCFGIRKLRAGLSIVLSIWITSAYVLVPILLFKQDMAHQSYGGYLCYSTDESVPLFWLGNFPRRVLDFIDIVFRVIVPVALMLALLVAAAPELCVVSPYYAYSSHHHHHQQQQRRSHPSHTQINKRTNAYVLTSPSCVTDQMYFNGGGGMCDSNMAINQAAGVRISYRAGLNDSMHHMDLDAAGASNAETLVGGVGGGGVGGRGERRPLTVPVMRRRLYAMAFTYAITFALCQLPFELYRAVLLFNSGVEYRLSYLQSNADFAIEIPLLLLKLINRCINPFLFVAFGDVYGLSDRVWRLWCLPCLPGCIGCGECWLLDCWHTCTHYSQRMGWTSRSASTSAAAAADNDDSEAAIKRGWAPTGLQTVSTYQYRDGPKNEILVTKQKVIDEFESGVEPYYKNPHIRDLPLLGIVNDSYVASEHAAAAANNDRYDVDSVVLRIAPDGDACEQQPTQLASFRFHPSQPYDPEYQRYQQQQQQPNTLENMLNDDGHAIEQLQRIKF